VLDQESHGGFVRAWSTGYFQALVLLRVDSPDLSHAGSSYGRSILLYSTTAPAPRMAPPANEFKLA